MGEIIQFPTRSFLREEHRSSIEEAVVVTLTDLPLPQPYAAFKVVGLLAAGHEVKCEGKMMFLNKGDEA